MQGITNQQIVLLFHFSKNTTACMHTCKLFQMDSRGAKKRMDTCIQKDQQINNSERYDSRCLGGRDSVVVSAATFDQKFKNRPCVADRRLSSPFFCRLLIPDIFLGRLFSGERLQTVAAKRGNRPGAVSGRLGEGATLRIRNGLIFLIDISRQTEDADLRGAETKCLFVHTIYSPSIFWLLKN